MALFDKAVDGVRDTTLLGASISVVSVLIMGMLFLSELWAFLSSDVFTHMSVNAVHEERETSIYVHVTFPYMPCSDLQAFAENTRGHNVSGPKSSLSLAQRPPSKKELAAMGPGYFERWGNGHRSRGCTMIGNVDIARAGGSLKIVAHKRHTEGDGVEGVNLTHYFHDLTFGTALPGVPLPLQGALAELPGTGQQQYSIKVIPISYQRRTGEAEAFQYSASSVFVDEREVMHLSGAKKFLGVNLRYDFSPIVVQYVDQAPGLLQFLTSSCAIVGGVSTVSGILVRCMQNAKPKKY
ncbi:unnamed protein product [Chrysoparadoxa australica]